MFEAQEGRQEETGTDCLSRTSVASDNEQTDKDS